MSKPTILIFALGIFITPVVFAAPILDGAGPKVVGEQSFTQISLDSPQAVRCGDPEVKVAVDHSVHSDTNPKPGSSTHAQ